MPITCTAFTGGGNLFTTGFRNQSGIISSIYCALSLLDNVVTYHSDFMSNFGTRLVDHTTKRQIVTDDSLSDAMTTTTAAATSPDNREGADHNPPEAEMVTDGSNNSAMTTAIAVAATSTDNGEGAHNNPPESEMVTDGSKNSAMTTTIAAAIGTGNGEDADNRPAAAPTITTTTTSTTAAPCEDLIDLYVDIMACLPDGSVFCGMCCAAVLISLVSAIYSSCNPIPGLVVCGELMPNGVPLELELKLANDHLLPLLHPNHGIKKLLVPSYLHEPIVSKLKVLKIEME